MNVRGMEILEIGVLISVRFRNFKWGIATMLLVRMYIKRI